jgi:hypothetical protein
MLDQRRDTDIMGVLHPDTVFQPYQIDDGWTVVMPGEEDGRRKKYGKTLFAETKVEVTLKSAEALHTCLSELAESDRRLRELSGGGMYDWQRVMIKGLTVRFGVAWYDRDFFEHRKAAYTSPEHMHVFGKFGASPSDFKVEHRIIDNSPNGPLPKA